MEYASFIISYNRPEMTTFKVMRDAGLTRDLFVLVENADPKLSEYKRKFGDVIVNPDKPLDCEPDKRSGVRFNMSVANSFAYILREEHKRL